MGESMRRRPLWPQPGRGPVWVGVVLLCGLAGCASVVGTPPREPAPLHDAGSSSPAAQQAATRQVDAYYRSLAAAEARDDAVRCSAHGFTAAKVLLPYRHPAAPIDARRPEVA